MRNDKPDSSNSGDLGFSYSESSGPEIKIFHHGRFATVLRNLEATNFLTDALASSFEEQQQMMARVTGNYKRGNERQAKNHPRNQ